MNPIIDAVDLSSLNITELQKQKLKALFPEVFTEGNKIDFERLKQTLGETVDSGKERFGMGWAGKSDCFKTIQQPSIATLVPAREESVDFDTTENLFIEGDNLEVLKLLQKSYLGKVKMIYIDPPYNTGNDFIYPDNYSENLETYLEYTGQIDGEGRKFNTNVETDGRFHSKWMNMMYPRLFLAKNLLGEDGVVFISIDEKEITNLRSICDEIFGGENFLGTIIWKNATDNNPTNIAIEHEYIIAFSKNKLSIEKEWKTSVSDIKNLLIKIGSELTGKYKGEILSEQYQLWYRSNKNQLWPLDRYKYIDEIGIYTGSQSVHNPGKEGYRYDVIHPITGKACKQPLMGYRFPLQTMENLIEEGKILYGDDETKIIELKVYAHEYEEKLSSLIELDGRLGAYDLKEDFPEFTKIFTNPKPVRLLSEIIPFIIKNNDNIILDFFCGSATTAKSTFKANLMDGCQRKFICIQLPEPTDEKSEAYKAGYQTIAEISKERIRRAAAKIKAEQLEAQAKPDLFDEDTTNTVLDLGFRVFKLQKSNFKVWDANTPKDPEAIQQTLELHIDHIDPHAQQEAILFELLLKSGFELTTPIKTLPLADKTVYSIADEALLICLDKALTPEVIRAMAELNPSRVICLDEGFQDNDQLKTNAVLIMKSKGVNDFRTV